MRKKRILVLGSNGMLGQQVVKKYFNSKKYELLTSSAEESSYIQQVEYIKLDITDKNSVKKVFLNFYPDTVINCAAYTNVDGCETNKELAWSINVKGVENLLQYSSVSDAHLIHISSDYIFDGKSGPYSENDKVNPISYYGRTKLAAENAILSSQVKSTIVRTNVLYGVAKFGRPDFVQWVISSLKGKKSIKIVDDQYNNPTFIDDLADAIWKFDSLAKYGTFHIGGEMVLNRYQFTIAIADYFNLDKDLISKIKTEDLNQAAPRPLFSGLKLDKAQEEINYKPTKFTKSFEIINNSI